MLVVVQHTLVAPCMPAGARCIRPCTVQLARQNARADGPARHSSGAMHGEGESMHACMHLRTVSR